MPNFFRQSRLQTRMTISYIWVTVLTVAVLEIGNALLLTLITSVGQFPNLGTASASVTNQRMNIGFPQAMIASSLADWLGVAFMVGTILLAAPLIGGFFGWLTTRGLVQRLSVLKNATSAVAAGEYTRQVSVLGTDELAQLERQFNAMARQLVESMRQRQELAAQNARLAERNQITRELHDAISQDLFSLRLLANGLSVALPADSPLRSPITSLEQTAASVVWEMRALLLELRPADSATVPLHVALEELAATYRERLGIVVTTTADPALVRSHFDRVLLLVAQEAVANAVRHAGAKAITIALCTCADATELVIDDDGSGFVGVLGAKRGLGLQLMRERMHEIGGSFAVETAPGAGTRIVARLAATPHLAEPNHA